MKKNVASQNIGAQMINAADGTAFTGAVTVYITGDAGIQAIGSVGSGACTHEGNGYHTYAPAQAETNYDLIAFTFIGTGAVPVTVQVYTAFPQTGDNYARIGAPTGASISADIATRMPTTHINATTGKVDGVALVDTTTTNTDMRGTDGANTTVPDNTTVGTINTKLGTPSADVSADIATRMPTTHINATAGKVDGVALTDTCTTNTDMRGTDGANTTVPDNTSIAAILVDTADMQPKLGTPATDVSADIAAVQADTNDIQTRVPAALIGGRMDSDVEAINNSNAAALSLEQSASTIVRGTATGTPTTTTMAASALTEATNDHYNGRIIIWTSGALKDQATDITAYNGTTKTFTFTAVTNAATAGDTFVIV